MWAEEAVFYQIYPLGLCGAPRENDGVVSPRILRVMDWIPHLKRLGIDAVYFCPLFDSDRHGYDTRDFRRLDPRLGTNDDLKTVCSALRQAGIRVVLDGVFNHVGRGFGAFEDVRKNRWDSPYKDWFRLSFEGDSAYHDGFWYEGWEGHYELVKLNLDHPEVQAYLKDCIRFWVEEFGIDGLRLDVAYCLPEWFLRELRSFCDSLKPDFFLVGETLHGDYNRWMGPDKLHSVTNYECYKGLYSSLNSKNLFEICHSLLRQFGPEQWTLYKGKHLLSFVDNHDVTRAASVLSDRRDLPLLYGMLFGMPGIPCLYYGSEWGLEGRKEQGDDALRPALERPEENGLTGLLTKMIRARKESPALCHGDFSMVVLQNTHCIWQRRTEGERVLVALNAGEETVTCHFDAGCGTAVDLITGEPHDFGGGSALPPKSVRFWKMER